MLILLFREIQEIIEKRLDEHILRICEELYWNDPDLVSPFDPKYNPIANPNRNGAYQDPKGRVELENYLKQSLNRATSQLTRLSIGKMTTQLIVQHLIKKVEFFTSDPIFETQKEVCDKVEWLARQILKERLVMTISL